MFTLKVHSYHGHRIYCNPVISQEQTCQSFDNDVCLIRCTCMFILFVSLLQCTQPTPTFCLSAQSCSYIYCTDCYTVTCMHACSCMQSITVIMHASIVHKASAITTNRGISTLVLLICASTFYKFSLLYKVQKWNMRTQSNL